MAKVSRVFERTEKKYMVTEAQRALLRRALDRRMEGDEFGKSTVCSLYLDTPDRQLIRESVEKPLYKEKLRLRSYGTPGPDDRVFLELKKKYDGVVYKRRETLTLAEAESLMAGGPPPKDTQIMRELCWALRSRGGLLPSALICGEREAFFCREDKELRITLDQNLRWRVSDLDLSKGSAGRPLTAAGAYIMEIKAAGAMPLWLAEALDDARLYPVSFSKYGTVYEKHILKGAEKTCLTPSFNRYSPIPSQAASISFAR